MMGVQLLEGANDFSSSLCIQTGTGVHPASFLVGSGGLFPGVKRGWGMTLTTSPSSNAKVKNV
jgi:hypothetical protein